MTSALSPRFGHDEIRAAKNLWECTCGPVAIACLLDLTLDQVRPLVNPGYRGWMNPTQMQAALHRAGKPFQERDRESLYRPVGRRQWGSPMVATHGITRIQFGGPWTEGGVPPSASYPFTHWVASVTTAADGCADVFDNNWGWMSFGAFLKNMGELAKECPRGSGEWWPTHMYEITDETPPTSRAPGRPNSP